MSDVLIVREMVDSATRLIEKLIYEKEQLKSGIEVKLFGEGAMTSLRFKTGPMSGYVIFSDGDVVPVGIENPVMEGKPRDNPGSTEYEASKLNPAAQNAIRRIQRRLDRPNGGR